MDRYQEGNTDALRVNLHHVIYALSDALDLVGVDDVAHGKRVAIMAAACARESGWNEERIRFMSDLGMLHDIGVSSTRTHGHLVAEFDWAGAQEHCETGYALLRHFPPLAHLALPIRYHHSRWDSLPGQDIDAPTALFANLVFLVDRVDALAAPYYADGSILQHAASLRDTIVAHRGRYFAPELVDTFLRASATEAFWLQLDSRETGTVLHDLGNSLDTCNTSFAELRQLAHIFSGIVDAKSPFTAAHSLGVARLARFLAEQMGVDPHNCDKLEIAGLLHDLGKLRIPDEILDKPAKLDEHERNIINTHSYETYRILRHIQGFEDITQWAACHHEKPDGTGYPFHLKGTELPLEARILRVADIFQAMVQDRPYRKGLDATALRAFMERMVERRQIDPAVNAVALAHLDQAISLAAPPCQP